MRQSMVVFTDVVNLATGAEKTYSLPVHDALIAAFEQEKGNYNTWDYPKPESVTFVEGSCSVGLGNWAVLTNKAGL